MNTAENALEKAIKDRLEEIENTMPEELRLQQINCRIDTDAFYALTRLAERLEMSRSAAAGFLLEAAIEQAWVLTGMPVVPLEGGHVWPAFNMKGEPMYDDYRKFMWEQFRISVNGYADEVAV